MAALAPRDIGARVKQLPALRSLPNTFELSVTRFGLAGESAGGSSGQKEKTPDRWLGADKAEHALISAYLTFFTFQVNREIFETKKSEARIVAVSATFLVGAAKETYDRTVRKSRFSLKDLVADGVGIAFGLWATTW